jgi:NADH-quinone oxidoreductase subunit C
VRAVERADWPDTLSGLREDGCTFLDVLTGIDRGDEIEIIARVVDPARVAETAGVEVVTTRVPAADRRLPSLVAVYPAAAWHERETAEMFGVSFDGHPDPRPLLRRSTLGEPPLLKTTVLAARVVTPWPGAADPGAGRRSSRRHRPPGVPDEWLREEGT